MLKELAASAAICAALWAQAGSVSEKTDILWRTDYDAAMKEAAQEKKPVFIAFVMDGEPANEEVLHGHFRHGEVAAFAGEFVCLLANISRHPQIERRAREQFMDSPRVAAPQFIFLRPDGKTIVLRHVWTLPAPELAKKMRTALALMDPSRAGDAEKQQRQLIEGWLVEAASNNAATRQAALAGLATADDPRIVEFFVKQTGESVDEMKRLEAIDAMACRTGNGAILPALHKLLSSGSSRVKTRAAAALRKIGAPESGPALASALKKEPKDRVKAALMRALAACDFVTPSHRKAILAAAKSSGQAERTAALRSLADVPLDAEIQKAIGAALKDSSNPVRAVAYFAAAKSQATELLPTAEKASGGEKSADVIRIAKAAVSGLKGEGFDAEEVGKLLAPYLTDDDLR